MIETGELRHRIRPSGGLILFARILWGIWLAAFIAGELFASRVPPVWWIYLFLAFIVLELHGALDKRKGDTLSETVWILERKGPARRIFGVALALALATRFLSLPFLLSGIVHPVVAYIPWILLSIGLAGWLAVHFGDLGKEG